MKDLESRLRAIKDDIKNMERMTELLRRGNTVLECFDRVKKEVV